MKQLTAAIAAIPHNRIIRVARLAEKLLGARGGVRWTPGVSRQHVDAWLKNVGYRVVEESGLFKAVRADSPVFPVKLTKPQRAFLDSLLGGAREATTNYPPALKLVELGFAVRVSRTNAINGVMNPRFYEITESGRAYRLAIGP